LIVFKEMSGGWVELNYPYLFTALRPHFWARPFNGRRPA